MLFFEKITKKIKKEKFISRSKKVSKLLKFLLKKNKIGIIDIGAGQRYLPTLLNFDGVSKIAMVDPNKNLEWSFNNFRKVSDFPENIKSFSCAIGDKTKKIKYYEMKRSTGSTCLDIYNFAKNKKQKLDNNYFGKKKVKKILSYSFKDFVKKKFLVKPDIVKIDVEGYETNVVNSLFKSYKPTLIEVEVNINHQILNNTFNKVNQMFVLNKYKLLTAFPVYNNHSNSFKHTKTNTPYIYGDYYNPICRASLEQMDCIYVKNNAGENFKKLSILIGYGLLIEAKILYNKLKKEMTHFECTQLESFFKSQF